MSALCKLLTDPAVQSDVERIFTVRNFIHSAKSHKKHDSSSDSADRTEVTNINPDLQNCVCASFATASWQRSQPIQCHTVDLSYYSVIVFFAMCQLRMSIVYFCIFKVCWIQMISTEVTAKSAWVLIISIQVRCSDFNHVLNLDFYIHHQLEQHNHFSISDTVVVLHSGSRAWGCDKIVRGLSACLFPLAFTHIWDFMQSSPFSIL